MLKQANATKLFIALIIPLVVVTLGGIFIYKSVTAFFFTKHLGVVQESNGPAVIYYSLTLVLALMFYFMREGLRGYEFAVYGSLSLVYSLSLSRITAIVGRPFFIYLIPMLLFFSLMWLVLKFIFLNRNFRSFRLLLFALLAAGAFSAAFIVQNLLLGALVTMQFVHSKFLSGLMLFIFMGFGFSLADYVVLKAEIKSIGREEEASDGRDKSDKQDDERG